MCGFLIWLQFSQTFLSRLYVRACPASSFLSSCVRAFCAPYLFLAPFPPFEPNKKVEEAAGRLGRVYLFLALWVEQTASDRRAFRDEHALLEACSQEVRFLGWQKQKREVENTKKRRRRENRAKVQQFGAPQ